jgi:transcription antitermination factor NusG
VVFRRSSCGNARGDFQPASEKKAVHGTEKGGALHPQIAGGEACCPSIHPRGFRPEWYAVQTLPRHEKSVTHQLESAGIHTVLPLSTEVRRWSDRRKVLSLPLFPCYVFVQVVDPNRERLRLLRTMGVVGFVGPRREASPIPPSQIEGIRSLVASSAEYRPHPYLAVGQRVRIRDGALRGLEGILVRIAEDHSLILSIDLIHKSVAVRIDGYALESI